MLERKVDAPPAASGSTNVDAYDAPHMMAQVLDALEQGLILWSAAGSWIRSNDAVYSVLGLQRAAISSAASFGDFLEQALSQGITFDPVADKLIAYFGSGASFEFHCQTTQGAAIDCKARGLRGGGYVMCFSDVSEARNAVEALLVAQKNAEEAERKAAAVLNIERAYQREAVSLAKLDEWLQSCKSLGELFEVVSAFMTSMMPQTQGQLLIYSNSRDVLVASSAWNNAPAPEQVTPDDCWALRRGRQYLYEADAFCFVCDHVKEGREGKGPPQSYICLPIVAHGETVGLLHVEFLADSTDQEFDDPVKFLSKCAERISMAIANVKLRDELQDQSTRDPLTGLYNRRFFLDALRREVMNARQTENSFALLAVDADHFKRFNDSHGHDAGDEVLRAIAELLDAIVSGRGIACRIGGEEFSLLLSRADRTDASQLAREACERVAELRVQHMGGILPQVTLSVGIAVYPSHGSDPKNLIKKADVALYEAKKAGRNCYKMAETSGMTFFE